MEFPVDPRVEVAFGARGEDTTAWEWTDVTGDLLGGRPIDITVGRQDEQSHVQPSEATLVLRDPRGHYMPDNPLSPHYPHVVQGTPLRVRLPDLQADSYLALPGIRGAYASTPSHSSFDITGDLDVRVDVEPDTWRPGESYTLLSRWADTADQHLWVLLLHHDGYLQFAYSPDGTIGSAIYQFSTQPVPPEAARMAVRCTLTADNGNGQHEIRFYTAPTIDGPWTQLGDTLTYSGTATLHTAEVPIEVGTAHGGTVALSWIWMTNGRAYAAEVRDGIDGLVVAAADFRDLEAGTRGFTDPAGREWTVHGQAHILDPRVRMHGSVAEWAPEWPYGDHSDEDSVDDPGEMTVSVTASGLLRRLGQGQQALRSPMYRAAMRSDVVEAYWPMEDGKNAAQMASAMGGDVMLPTFTAGLTSDIDMAAYDEFDSSAALPVFHRTGASAAIINAPDTGEIRLSIMVHVPEDGPPGEARVVGLRTTGTAAEWSMQTRTSGARRLVGYDVNGAVIVDSGWYGPSTNGEHQMFGFHLRQNGTSIDWEFFRLAPEYSSGYGVVSGTLAGHRLGRPTTVLVGGAGDLGGTALGHLMVHSAQQRVDAEILDAFHAHLDEPAADRIVRLCAEEGVRVEIQGQPSRTERCGPQGIDTLLNLLQSAADADGGILHEMRSLPGVAYRTRVSLYNPQPRLLLDAARGRIGDIVNPFAPVLDDQNVRNDVTVSRPSGSSARAVDEDDIARRGRYDESITLNVASDGQLEPLAGWRLHLGTWPGMRYPSISPALNAMPDLIEPWTAVNLGDRIDVIRLPPQHPASTVSELVQGWTESWLPNRVGVQANATPAGPWRVAVFDHDTLGRAATVHSEVVADVQAGTDTQFEVVSGRLETFEQPELLVDITSGPAPWFRDNTTAYSGTWSLRSGDIGDSAVSDAILTVPAWAHWISFAYRVSSEEGFDYFRVLHGTALLFEDSGDTGWLTSPTLSVVPGATLTLRYVKDSLTAYGSDCVWIDDLTWIADAGWATDAQMPLDITASGVRLRVTSITGEGPVQTFTVEQQPVNGVVKTIPRGASVQIADPAVLAP